MGTVTELHPQGAVLWAENAIADALRDSSSPGAIVSDGLRLGLMRDPRGDAENARVLCRYPAIGPEDMGAPEFRATHQVRYACKAGAMANGIASPALVIAMAKAGLLASYGAGGVPVPEATAAIAEIRQAVGERPFAVNLIHAPHERAMEDGIVDAMLTHDVRLCEASAFMAVQKSVVRYRAAGLSCGPGGGITARNRVVAKVSHPKVAEQFMRPAPPAMLDAFVSDGSISSEQRDLALRVPVADDITAEADSGGHTDRKPMGVLLPILMRLRDRIMIEQGYAERLRVGAAGGIGSPRAAAGAFATGADYIVTGSVNQACIESGSSDAVRAMLAAAGISDCGMAPAADMFEMGVELQVLKRGTLFPGRAKQLYELYRGHESIDALPEKTKNELEAKFFKRPLSQVWDETAAYFGARDPAQVVRAENDPKRKMALIFRSYLGQSSHWANSGVEDRKHDYQVWSGPSIGDFNDWTADSYLADPVGRRIVDVTEHIMRGAAFEARLTWLRLSGVRLPFAPTYEVAPL